MTRFTQSKLAMPLIVLLCLVVPVSLAQTPETPQAICENATIEDPETRQYDAAPEMALEPGVDYRAIFCTGAGAIYVDLFENFTPSTVNNFVFLAQNDYYNNSNFHRVLQDFMAQGGDPVGDPPGTGGPGYQFQDEFAGFLQFDRVGLLAMANAGPSTNGSQFFLTTSEPDYLNYRHTIFGEIITGYDNLLNIELRDPQASPEGDGTALDTIIIITDPGMVDVEGDLPQVDVMEQETIAEALETITANLPEDLTVNSDFTGTRSTDDVIDAAPDDVRDDFAALLDETGHQYRVSRQVDNSGCTTDAFFSMLSYTVDAFASADDAKSFYNSDLLTAFNEADGYTGGERSDFYWIRTYEQEATTCDDAPGTRLRGYFLRGPYVATAEVVVPAALLEQAPADAILHDGVAQVFEQSLAGIYRPTGDDAQ